MIIHPPRLDRRGGLGLLMDNVYKPEILPGWQQVLTGPPAESAACVLFHGSVTQGHLLFGRRVADGHPVGLGGAPGGDITRGETPCMAASRITREETGLDLSAHYIIYQGQRDFPIRKKPQPVHLYICFIDWAARDDTDRARLRRADWTSERRDLFERSLNCGTPVAQAAGRFQQWDKIPITEAEAHPQIYSPVIRWALEVVCKKPPEIELPWEAKGVPIRVAGHIGEMND